MRKKNNNNDIFSHFNRLKDPRVDRTKLHKLIDIIVITICAIICGAKTWVDIETVGKAKITWFKRFLELPNGLPSHDTIARVMAALDPAQFKNCFLSWIKDVRKITKGDVIPIDGKTLRRSFDKKREKSAIHMVSAWSTKNNLVLGQIKVSDKSNEITAIPELLNLLEIKGCIITIDAMGCQKEIAKKIIEGNGDYILALKGNNKRFYEDIVDYFEYAINENKESMDYYETTTVDHGRIDKRKYWVSDNIDWFEEKKLWKGLQTIVMTITESTVNNKQTIEKRFFISSVSANAKEIGDSIRSHWSIENSLHWVLDIAFREDECRIRKGDAPENLAISRHIALGLLKQEKSLKRGIAGKQFFAAMNSDYLTKVVFGE